MLKFHLWTEMNFHVQPCFPLHQISWWDISWHGRLTWYLLSLSIVCLFFHTLLRVLQCNTHLHFFIISTSYIELTHIWLLRPAVMSSVPTNDYARCQCCNASFQRLSSHLSRNEFVALTIKTCHWTEATVVLLMMCMPVVWHISTRLVLRRAHKSQQEFIGVLQHLGTW